MNIKQIKLTQISLLTITILLTTGCFGLFENEAPSPTLPSKNVIKAIENPQVIVNAKTIPNTKIMPISHATNPIFIDIAPECSDEIGAVNACQKELIQTQELTPKTVDSQSGGEIHKLKSIQGQDITIIERPTGYEFPELQDKIVILEMFGKNCSHCIKEMPIMNKLHKKYRSQLEIIALQVESKMSPMQAKALIKRHRITYPLISGETATNLQYHVQTTYGWTGILPFIMVIKNGVTEFTYRGQVSHKEINKDIRSLL